MSRSLKGMKIPSNVIYNNNILPQVKINRSTFNLSEGHKTTFNGGDLIPIYWEELNPGDTFNFKIKALLRLATPITPIMDNVRVKFYSFFVPNRLLWENWQRFMGERLNPNDSIDYQVPQVTTGKSGVDYLTLADYMGIRPKIPNVKVTAFPFRAYNLIWNEWFRDENFQDSLEVKTDDADQNVSEFKIQKKNKSADYFTTCLPSPQKGDPVVLPLGQKARLVTDVPLIGDYGLTVLATKDGSRRPLDLNAGGRVSIGDVGSYDQYTELYADLSNATSATINDIRKAFQVQRILEKDARQGTRYIEIVQSHWGVQVPDYRLQRPEYLGGGSIDVNITPIVQTSATVNQPTPQGTLGAVGVAGSNGNGYVYSATEHGIVITLACLDADINYQQGLPRKFSKLNRFDYMFPSFWYLGEQAVLNKEIYLQGTAEDEQVFGYQQRYRELREGISKISGLFRSDHPQSLDVWHLAEEFGNLPKLNGDFMKCNVPFDRVLAVQDEPHLIGDFYFEIRAIRPLPSYVEPGLIDHF